MCAARCRTALDQLDSAAIGTLHSLRPADPHRAPVEAGLPPRVEVLDEVSSDVEFDRRWSAFQDELLADAALERTLLLLFAAGVQPDGAATRSPRPSRQNWDLVDERVPRPTPRAADASRQLLDAGARRRRRGVRATHRVPLSADDDKLARPARRHRGLRRPPARASTDELELLERARRERAAEAAELPGGQLGQGRQLARHATACACSSGEAGEQLAAVRDDVADACAHRLGAAIRRFTLAAAEERRAAGRLEFHDLLVLARVAAARPATARRCGPGCTAATERLLLDEFQDTDPIQIELAVRIAAADPARPRPQGRRRGTRCRWPPGHLFVVGDPKQSIYRFRRADISTFLAAASRFGRRGGARRQLTANFRSTAPVIDWVNARFGALDGRSSPARAAGPSQPDYVALARRPRRRRRTARRWPCGRRRAPARRDVDADDAPAAEAGEVAATVVQVVDEGWTVGDGDGGWRPARLGDITILVPARTSLPFLEDALRRLGIPYRAESSSLVYATRAVRDLLMVLRAVDDPTDHLAHRLGAAHAAASAAATTTSSASRSSAGAAGATSATSPTPCPPTTRCASGLALPARRCTTSGSGRRRRSCSTASPATGAPSSSASPRAGPATCGAGCASSSTRPGRGTRRPAGACASTCTGSTLQTHEGGRVAEAVLPETDDDAVRIMTIHAAKGLEFPITIVSGMSTVPQGAAGARRGACSRPPAESGYRFGAQGRHRGVPSWSPDRRADELPRAHPAALRRLHPGAGPPRRLAPPQGARQGARARQAHERRAAASTGWATLLDDLPDAGDEERDPLAAPPVRRRPSPLRRRSTSGRAERDAALARGDPRHPPSPRPRSPTRARSTPTTS